VSSPILASRCPTCRSSTPGAAEVRGVGFLATRTAIAQQQNETSTNVVTVRVAHEDVVAESWDSRHMTSAISPVRSRSSRFRDRNAHDVTPQVMTMATVPPRSAADRHRLTASVAPETPPSAGERRHHERGGAWWRPWRGRGKLDISAPYQTFRRGAVGTAHTKTSSRASGARRTGCQRSQVQRECQAAARPDLMAPRSAGARSEGVAAASGV
jgi:hypothetical protein